MPYMLLRCAAIRDDRLRLTASPAGGCHSNGDTFRCALYFLDLLSSRSCPAGNEIELNSYGGRLKFLGDRFRNMAIRLGAISGLVLDTRWTLGRLLKFKISRKAHGRKSALR